MFTNYVITKKIQKEIIMIHESIIYFFAIRVFLFLGLLLFVQRFKPKTVCIEKRSIAQKTIHNDRFHNPKQNFFGKLWIQNL